MSVLVGVQVEDLSAPDKGWHAKVVQVHRIPVAGDYISFNDDDAAYLVQTVILRADPKPGEVVAYVRYK